MKRLTVWLSLRHGRKNGLRRRLLAMNYRNWTPFCDCFIVNVSLKWIILFQTGRKFVGKVLWHVENKWVIIYCRTPVKNTFRVLDNFFHLKYYFCHIDIVEYQFIFLSRRTTFNRTKVELKLHKIAGLHRYW